MKIEQANKLINKHEKEDIPKINEQLETIATNGSWFKLNKNQFIAHKGCWMFSPENTLASIYDAKRYGFDFVELDINKTLDGVYILMHDDTVDRTTDGTGRVDNLTKNQIDNLNIDVGIYKEDEVYKVPTFESAVELCSKLKLGINIDCSKIAFTDTTINEVITIIQKYSMLNNVFFVISNTQYRDNLIRFYPNACVTWTNPSIASVDDNINECKKYTNCFVSHNVYHMTNEVSLKYKQNGVKIFLYGCDSLLSVDKALSYNPIFIETDTQINQERGVI